MALSASSTAGAPMSPQCTITSESREAVDGLGSDQTVRIRDHTDDVPAALWKSALPWFRYILQVLACASARLRGRLAH